MIFVIVHIAPWRYSVYFSAHGIHDPRAVFVRHPPPTRNAQTTGGEIVRAGEHPIGSSEAGVKIIPKMHSRRVYALLAEPLEKTIALLSEERIHPIS